MAVIGNPNYGSDWVQLAVPWRGPNGQWYVEGTQFNWTQQVIEKSCCGKGTKIKWLVHDLKDCPEVILDVWIEGFFGGRTSVPFIQSNLNPIETIYDQVRQVNTQFDLPANLANEPGPYFLIGTDRVPAETAIIGGEG